MNVHQLLQLWCLGLQFLISGIVCLSPVFLCTLSPTLDISQLSLSLFTSVSVGSFIGGILSDLFGRRWVLIGSVALMFLGTVVNFWNVYVGFMVFGLGCGPANNISFVYVSETVKINRQRWCVFLVCGWAVGEVVLGGMFWGEGWEVERYYAGFCAGMGAVLLLSVLFLKETPTFINQNTIRRFRNPLSFSHYKQLVLGCLMMFAIQMFYYRTQFTLDRYGLSLPLNTIIVGICQFFTNILCGVVITHLPRKLSLLIIFLLLLICFVILNLFTSPLLQTIIQGIMRISDCFAMAVLGVYLPELFSARERGRAVNFIMCFGVLGGGVAPEILDNAPWWVLTLPMVVAWAAVVGLRETKGKGEIEPIEEIDCTLITEKDETTEPLNDMC